ncbi:MAG: hypothetical protein ACE5ID_08395 [Acidobacteriota bacterium]
MTFLSQTVPVALAVAGVIAFACLCSRSLLYLMFGALNRRASNRPLDPALD